MFWSRKLSSDKPKFSIVHTMQTTQLSASLQKKKFQRITTAIWSFTLGLTQNIHLFDKHLITWYSLQIRIVFKNNCTYWPKLRKYNYCTMHEYMNATSSLFPMIIIIINIWNLWVMNNSLRFNITHCITMKHSKYIFLKLINNDLDKQWVYMGSL